MPHVELALTLVGAGAGSVLRYLLGGWVGHRMGPEFPWGTLAVNALGCLGLGLLEGAAPHERTLLLVLGSGLLGGFTTFSTLMLETINLAASGERDRAFFNVVGSLALGLFAFSAGAEAGAWVAG
ncbi:Putative fluoride ion transporter CrcB [Rubrobacter xylanophilus DSM 9941]|uniref:fluoride efflux transporter CrcB n=1 Tax=Rubrobacter xylanophilus TaxID=49319 RepID=UPI001C641F6E|nr:fluoride efflux transporter CrcB [Rubrobacter xylanophilus]QYJ16748.1 Putative fluoride ion transporter CrcB [Rubrobacter xylanophilus DSM 9941]